VLLVAVQLLLNTKVIFFYTGFNTPSLDNNLIIKIGAFLRMLEALLVVLMSN